MKLPVARVMVSEALSKLTEVAVETIGRATSGVSVIETPVCATRVGESSVITVAVSAVIK